MGSDAENEVAHVNEVEADNSYNIDINACLAAHNAFRAKHGAPPLQWDDSCAQYAQRAAQECLDEGNMHHNNIPNGQGQNLYMSMTQGSDNEAGAKTAVSGWYSEVNDPGYDFDNPGFDHGTGHFTQVVWKGTTKVGMAKVRGDQDGWDTVYIAANYAPAGNMEGDFEQNVLPEQ